MTTRDGAPEHIFLTTKELFERFKCGRSKGYQILRSPGFPPRIGMGYRLDTVLAWEQTQIDAAVPAPTGANPCHTCAAAPRTDRTPSGRDAEPASMVLGPPRTRRAVTGGDA